MHLHLRNLLQIWKAENNVIRIKSYDTYRKRSIRDCREIYEIGNLTERKTPLEAATATDLSVQSQTYEALPIGLGMMSLVEG